jgi:hypothetical protein
MTWQLGGSIAGLAALDSLNPATLVAITLILLSSRRRQLAEAIGFVIGAFTTVFLVGLALYSGAEAAASAVAGALTWLRRGAFGLAALVLFVSAVRSLRARRRATIGLPDWFTPATAAGLGVVMTGADLPNAFPYFIAIERLLATGLTTPIAPSSSPPTRSSTACRASCSSLSDSTAAAGSSAHYVACTTVSAPRPSSRRAGSGAPPSSSPDSQSPRSLPPHEQQPCPAPAG